MNNFNSVWGEYFQAFIEYKKMSGYKYDSSADVVIQFDRYYETLGLSDLQFTRSIIEPFLYLKPKERISNQMFKASVLRQFGKYIFLNDIIKDIYIIPPISQKGETQFIPYIFEKQQLINIVNYLENYDKIPKPKGTFPLNCNTLNAVNLAIKILISTGMRLGGVFKIRSKDIDFKNKLITILEAKNFNQRVIPISQTLMGEIIKYIEKTPFVIRDDDYLMQFDSSKYLTQNVIYYFFRVALKANNIKHIKGMGPRIHDFRHTFAVMSLTQLQRTEKDVNLSLSYLSNYLGHKSLKETQKYIWLVPSLFEDIKKRMESHSSFIPIIFAEEKFDEDE